MINSSSLKEIAQAFSGLPTNKIHKSEIPNGLEVMLLTTDAIMENNRLDIEKLKTVWVDSSLPEKFFLKGTDIICPLRGMVFKPTLIEQNSINGKRMITSSNNAIIRHDSNLLLPEVLFFYLNSSWFRKHQIEKTQSNFILINLKTLKESLIPVPEKSIQACLAQEFYEGLTVKEKLTKLVEVQHQAIEAQFLSTLLPNISSE